MKTQDSIGSPKCTRTQPVKGLLQDQKFVP
jgi:hypothetical protein